MGKCLSTCMGSESDSQNGHFEDIPTVKPTFTTLQSVATSEVSKTPPASVNDSIDSDSHSVQRKMFNPYPKLPPIKKASNGVDSSSKKLSLTSKEVSETKILTLFDSYKDSDEDNILAEGTERFCKDLGVKPDDFQVLVLAWKFDVVAMCKFTRTEFVTGFKNLKIDSIKGMQSKFPDMLKEVKDPDTFKEFYKWTYKFGLDVDTGQKTLPTDIAVALWRLVFTQNEPPILQRWLDFVEKHPVIKGIPRDTWDMFLNFVETIGDDLGCYNDTDAWPSLFDDFVEYENDRQNQNVTDEEIKHIQDQDE